MNLQMFAEANTQTTGGLSAEMKTYYGMELLENAKPQLVHNQFAATKGLPAGGGKTVEWRKFGAFDKALKPLTEGVTPDGSGISVSYITKELAQYGDYTTVSDMLDLTAIDDVVLEITDRHGSNMGLTLDTVTRNEIQQGKQVIYAMFDEAFERLLPGGTLTIVIRKQQGAPSAQKHLLERFGNAETIARGGGYHVIRSRKEATHDDP